MSLSNALKNIGGEFEIGRILLASGGAAAIVSPIIFQAWAIHNGASFDVTSWCVAYPGGLAALTGIGVFSVGKKEQAVAAARQTAGAAAGEKSGA